MSLVADCSTLSPDSKASTSSFSGFSRVRDCEYEVICEDPVILRFKEFLTASECEGMIDLCRPLVKQSEAIGATNRNCESETVHFVKNTSWVTWMDHGEETEVPLISGILERVKEKLGILFPPNNETMQIHRYEPGQVCEAHHDFFENGNYFMGRYGQRLATLIFYLNTVENGGHTKFPRLDVKVTPVLGDVIFFHNVLQNGEPDIRTLHEGEAATGGDKWIAIKVINTNKFANL